MSVRVQPLDYFVPTVASWMFGTVATVVFLLPSRLKY